MITALVLGTPSKCSTIVGLGFLSGFSSLLFSFSRHSVLGCCFCTSSSSSWTVMACYGPTARSACSISYHKHDFFRQRSLKCSSKAPNGSPDRLEYTPGEVFPGLGPVVLNFDSTGASGTSVGAWEVDAAPPPPPPPPESREQCSFAQCIFSTAAEYFSMHPSTGQMATTFRPSISLRCFR